MKRISYKKFKKVFDFLPRGSEFDFWFYGTEDIYKLIKFKEGISFQRYGGNRKGSGEFFYDSFEELYEARTVDHKRLKNDWDKIECIYVNEVFRLPDEYMVIFEEYRRRKRSGKE